MLEIEEGKAAEETKEFPFALCDTVAMAVALYPQIIRKEKVYWATVELAGIKTTYYIYIYSRQQHSVHLPFLNFFKCLNIVLIFKNVNIYIYVNK